MLVWGRDPNGHSNRAFLVSSLRASEDGVWVVGEVASHEHEAASGIGHRELQQLVPGGEGTGVSVFTEVERFARSGVGEREGHEAIV